MDMPTEAIPTSVFGQSFRGISAQCRRGEPSENAQHHHQSLVGKHEVNV